MRACGMKLGDYASLVGRKDRVPMITSWLKWSERVGCKKVFPSLENGLWRIAFTGGFPDRMLGSSAHPSRSRLCDSANMQNTLLGYTEPVYPALSDSFSRPGQR